MSVTDRLAQALVGLPFLWLGYDAVSDPGPRIDIAAELGLPKPELAVRFNGAAMMVGGAALIVNVLPRAAAAGLIASLVPTSVAGHPAWKYDDPGERQGQRIQLLKNAGLAGGLLAVALREPSTQ